MSQDQIERRYVALEIRESDGDGPKKPKLTGYAAVFNKRSEEMWGFEERIASGAFKKTLQEADVRALWNHDSNIVLGRTKSGTLSLAEDEKGLAVEIEPPDNQTIRDLVLDPIRRGDVDQMSFGFRTIRDQWEEIDDVLVRTLLEVRLYEVSPCAIPAYPQTSISARAQERVTEFRSKRQATETSPAPGQSAHPDEAESQITKPDAPIIHLADWRMMRLELAKRRVA